MTAPSPADLAAPSSDPATPTFHLVPFHDSEILAAELGAERLIPMKRFCGTLGLPWDGQRRRIQRTELLREAAVMMTAPTDGGEQEQTALPLWTIPGFLLGVDVARLAPATRAHVRTFQREAYAVLHDHFSGRGVVPAAAPLPAAAPALPAPMQWQERAALRGSVPELIALITAEIRTPVRLAYHALLRADCDRLGLACPPLGALGQDAAELVDRLVAGLDLLTARKVAWNRLAGRDAVTRLAVDLAEIARLFARHGVDVAVDERLRTALDTSTHRWRIWRQTIGEGRRAIDCHVLEARS